MIINILTSSIFLLIFGFSQIARAQPTIITGFIENYEVFQDSICLDRKDIAYTSSILAWDSLLIVFEIQIFDIGTSKSANIEYANRKYPIYLMPNDSISIRINQTRNQFAVEFERYGMNQYQSDLRQQNYEISFMENAQKLPYSLYMSYIDSIEQLRNRFVRDYRWKDKPLPSSIIKNEIKSNKYHAIISKTDFPVANALMNERVEKQIPANHYAFFETNKVWQSEKDELLFARLCEKYMEAVYVKAIGNQVYPVFSASLSDSLYREKMYRLMEKETNPRIKYTALNRIILFESQNNRLKARKWFENLKFDQTKLPDYKDFMGILYQTNEILFLDGSTPYPSYLLKGQKGKLTDYRGKKVVFLIFWASWCRACIQNISFIQQLAQQYGDKIDFLSISIDDDEFKWKSTVRNRKMFGSHLLERKGFKSDLSKFYELTAVPAYFFIQKDGTILSAASPNKAEIHTQIGDLLAK
jgi:thiol-disulfide isomerase/thioredoxin